MKLIVQIPCFNEAETLPLTVAAIPRHIPAIDRVEILVIDDGSTDRTGEVARRVGVDHVVRHAGNKGLAQAFQTGLETCLRLGADIIVNTDADNQYPGHKIPQLVEPILRGEADMVIGNRQTRQIQHFSPVKKLLQAWGSWFVRLASNTSVPDAPSGFRAMTRETATRLNIFTRYTYTLETIVQAGKKNLTVAHVPITTGPQTRESRLIHNTWAYVWRSTLAILRLYILYEPMRTFLFLSVPFLLVGSGLIARFLYLFFTHQSGIGRHVQSVVIGGTLLTLGLLIVILGVLSDLIATNRRLLEEILYHTKAAAASQRATASAGPPHPANSEDRDVLPSQNDTPDTNAA